MLKQVVILAAGMGTRLASNLPKPLTELRDGRSIMKQQIDNLDQIFGNGYRVSIVVGYKLESIMERFPRASFVYNELFDQTNTSKSLLRALEASQDGGVLWLNGDVVFDPQVLTRALPLIEASKSFVAVNTAKVGEEEVKYTLSEDGFIKSLSKQVDPGLGEAVGINFIASQDKAVLIKRLLEVGDQDYFEKALEMAIEKDAMKLSALEISDLYAVEVDFAEDLERANEHF